MLQEYVKEVVGREGGRLLLLLLLLLLPLLLLLLLFHSNRSQSLNFASGMWQCIAPVLREHNTTWASSARNSCKLATYYASWKQVQQQSISWAVDLPRSSMIGKTDCKTHTSGFWRAGLIDSSSRSRSKDSEIQRLREDH